MSPEKPQYSAFPWKAVPLVMETLIDGAKKHGWRNWQKQDKQLFYEAYLRHHMAMLSGEDIDPESKLPHMWHAAANLMIFIDLQARDGAVAMAAEIERAKQNKPDFPAPRGFVEK